MSLLSRVLSALSLLALIAACAPQAAVQEQSGAQVENMTITVMAAASLTAAFREIGQLFEQQHPGVRVVFSFAGSQQLAQQLSQSAPADVFASANSVQMDLVVSSKRVDPLAVHIFANNKLVIIFPGNNPAQLTRLEDLKKPGLKLVFAAKEVPAGLYALEVLEKASQPAFMGQSFQEEVLKNVVSYEDNVRVVLTKVALGEADAGIVYSSDAAGKPAADLGQIPIPEEFNVTARYPIAVINDSKNLPHAQLFLEVVLSPAGQQILQKYGFQPGSQAGQ